MRAHATPELPYRIRWTATDGHVGSHRSRVAGAGDDIYRTVPLGEGRDARRLDLRASATDPLERPWVREFRQRSRVPVVLVADLSRSMRFTGRADRLGLVAQFARGLALGATRRGDPFGFIGCDQEVRRDLCLAPVVSRHAGERLLRRLERLGQEAASSGPGPQAGAQGLLQAARWLPRQRSLVFLLSDLYLDAAMLERVLRSLAAHDCVVLMLADSAERQPPARWGLVRLADLESGRERLVLLRPGLAERMAARQAERIETARSLARRQGASLLVVEDLLDAQALARHFMARGGR